jgi:hypothetical protein
VTYLSAPAAAAPTIVLQRPSPLLADESPCGAVPAATACWPAVGRHLAFDGKLLHGALPDLTPRPPAAAGSGPRPRAAPTKRVTFLVNVWLNHAPWGAEALPESVRARLGGTSPKLGLRKARRATRGTIDLGAGKGGVAAAAGRKAPKPRADASRQAAQPLSWTFGEAKAQLRLTLPWPEQAVEAAFAGASAPVLDVSFAPGVLGSLEEVPQASRKRKKTN